MKRTLLLTFCFLITQLWSQNSTAEKAKAAYDKKNYKEAIKQYSKLIDINNATYMDFYYRANSYFESKMAQEAYNDYSACLKLAPDFAEAWFLRGCMLINDNQAQDAINDLNMAVKYAKNDTIRELAYSNRGGAKLYVQNYDGAIKDCREALKMDSIGPRSRNSWLNMSTAYGYQSKYDVSIPILKKLYQKDSSDIPVISNLGFELSLTEKYDDALYYFNRALKINPNEAYALSNKSYALLKLGKANEALGLINKSISLMPGNSYAYKNLGLIYLDLKQKDKACEAFDTAVKKGFNDMYGGEVRELISTHCR